MSEVNLSTPRPHAFALLLTALFVLCPPDAAAGGRYYNDSSTIETSHPDWMRWIPDTTSLAALSLPGSHDTMANDAEWYVTEFERLWIYTQSLELRPQLDAGIRVLDIRARHIGDRFAIHHDKYYVRANFDDVLGTAIQFLKEHPTETILMRVKKEHTEENTTRSFAATFKWYRDQPAYNQFIWTGTSIPTLGKVRGKIVIIDDFGGGTYGISWDSLNKQDEWTETNTDTKWNLVRAQLDETNADSSNTTLYINFLSASGVGGYPSSIADDVNEDALQYLVAGNVQRTGVLMMDFPGAGLIDAIIAHNFRLVPSSDQPQSDFDSLFKNIAYSFHGDANERWNQMKTFLYNVLPGRIWQWMVLKSPASLIRTSEGLSSQSSEIDGYTHAAFTVRSLDTAVSQSTLKLYTLGRLPLLSGNEWERGLLLHLYLTMSFPFQSWTVVVKKAPGGLDNWTYATYGANPVYKLAIGDYIYAIWGYAPQEGVYLYEHGNHEGQALYLNSANPWLGDADFNDRVSSVRIIGKYQARFYEHGYYGGVSLHVPYSQGSLPSDWNDRVSSVDVWKP